ncbi:ImuA family protein [Hansschlegelia beijingensis]|uniref:Protein ImuA n=1 Tax=Hansschlegelia beijingensis TaxID=1133344 RepID=A0A7W6GGI4_9HYPH|nr:DNA repair protein [Hansschlegelia beijingensis]MBB3974133.1 protein ImuA [Hansschlegelia beijingensis]
MGAAEETLGALRSALARIDAGAGRPPRSGSRVTLGVGPVDDALGGGLRRGALHAVTAASAAAAAAASGFAAALAARSIGEGRAVLWIRQDMAGCESGEPWPPGLAELGLDPARIVLFRAPNMDAALKAAETALGCRALAAALIEPYGALRRFDLVAGRRLALAAGRSGVMALLLRTDSSASTAPGLSIAETRWRVSPLASSSAAEDWGWPRATVELVRNRLGPLGRWPLEWADDGRFRLIEPAVAFGDDAGRSAGARSAHPGARFAEPLDRQGAAEGGVFRRRAG